MLLLLPALYGFLTLGVLILALRSRVHDALVAATTLAFLWAMTNISQAFIHQPYNQLYPVLDVVAATCLAWFWRSSLSIWKVIVILLLLGDLGIHAFYFSDGDVSVTSRYVYDLKLNFLYCLQLLFVTYASLAERRDAR